MLKKLVQTQDDAVLTVLRITLGVVMFPHGAQKVLGWFGGGGIGGTIGFFNDALGIPAVLTVLVIMAEFFGAIGLIAGAFSRIAASGIIAVMLGAVAMVHLPNGFFMNWTGQQAGEGFEFHILVVAMAAILVWKGSGAASVDRSIAEKLPAA